MKLDRSGGTWSFAGRRSRCTRCAGRTSVKTQPMNRAGENPAPEMATMIASLTWSIPTNPRCRAVSLD